MAITVALDVVNLLTLRNPATGVLFTERDTARMQYVVGGAAKDDPGNSAIQDRANASVLGSNLGVGVTGTLVSDGINVNRIPYTWVDDSTLTSTSQTVKEALARGVERGYITVNQSGVVLTAAQVRAL